MLITHRESALKVNVPVQSPEYIQSRFRLLFLLAILNLADKENREDGRYEI
jgi:hypothetical protein